MMLADTMPDSTPNPATPYYGVFDLFKIGIGPSSSHSVGPMRAAAAFAGELAAMGVLRDVERVQVNLFGSLALTGIGHGTDTAVLLGLEAETPENVDPAQIADRLARIRETKSIHLNGDRSVRFVEESVLIFHRRETLPFHPNGMRFRAVGSDARVLHEVTCFSIGGGFVVREGETTMPSQTMGAVPYPFSSARELLHLTEKTGMSFSDLALANEVAFRSEAQIRQGLKRIRDVMRSCIERGCQNRGILPGGLEVVRRAPALFEALQQRSQVDRDPLLVLDWVDLYAIAVNEENAAGGRVVTAPTNGAAGIVPAVLQYAIDFCRDITEEKSDRYLLTASLIGALYKTHASISGAEVGCQGEVGVACSMAAGALTEILGGTPRQVEQAAEIGMEHNLGLTCDPIRGLVQIPCIERNAMGAVKAINASRIALRGDGTHMV